MWLTRLDIQIGWLLFLDYLKECQEAWKKLFHLTDEQLLAPGFVPGYAK